MPDRSVKMKRRIFGFQRRVWWPKWTPASSRSRMVATAIGLLLVWIRSAAGGAWSGPASSAGTVALGGFRRVGGTGRGKSSGRSRSLASRAGTPERCGEVVRQRRGNVHRRARDRMRKREPRGVQELPFEADLAASSVGRVARDRQVDRREMHAD